MSGCGEGDEISAQTKGTESVFTFPKVADLSDPGRNTCSAYMTRFAAMTNFGLKSCRSLSKIMDPIRNLFQSSTGIY